METEDVPGNNISILFLAMFLVLFFITFVLSNAFDGQLVRCKENLPTSTRYECLPYCINNTDNQVTITYMK